MTASRRTRDPERSHRDDDERRALASRSSGLPAAHARVLALQDTAGNQAVAALTRSLREETRMRSRQAPVAPDVASSPPRLPLTPVQRAVILLDVNPVDYALQKVLIGLGPNNHRLVRDPDEVETFARDRTKNPRLRAMIPYRNLEDVAKAISKRRSPAKAKAKQKDVPAEAPAIAADEDVYIVGHGRRDLVWTAPGHGAPVTDFAPLALWLKSATPEGWTGTTHFLTCNAAREDERGTETVTAKLKKGLSGTPVTGHQGFVYGMGTRGVRVLKPEFDALYNADEYDEAVGKHLTMMAHRSSEASNALGYKPPANQIANAGEWKKVWELFKKAMKALESQMKAAAKALPDDKDILANAQALSTDRDFQGLIREQDALFSAFKLWRGDT